MTNKEIAEGSTILRCIVGSQAYGLSTDSADRDEKGVCIEPFDTAWRLKGEFEQYEFRTAAERTGKHDARSEPGDLDLTIYSLRKYLRLAAYGNPNVLELLFITDTNRLTATREGFDLQDLYPEIVSRNAGRRYLGYMEAQKQRLLGERGQMRVTRTDLIDKHGYDTKYASHLIRLGYQGVELQETGMLKLPIEGQARTDLLAIKAGKWGLDEVTQLAGSLEQTLKDLIKEGQLPDEPDYDYIEGWMRGVYFDAWEGNL